MQYDSTAPPTVDERKSLLVMLCLIAGVALGIWWLLRPASPAASMEASTSLPATSLPVVGVAAAAPSKSAAGVLQEGVTRREEGLTIVKAGPTVVHLYRNEENVWPTRSYDPADKGAAEEWELAQRATAIVRNPAAAERYDAAGAVDKLKNLDLRPPQLTLAERARLRELFFVAEEAKGADREKADQALRAAVATMPIPPEDQQAFDRAVDAARNALTPEQLRYIHMGGKPPATKPGAKPRPSATRAATRPAARPAARSTQPATAPAPHR